MKIDIGIINEVAKLWRYRCLISGSKSDQAIVDRILRQAEERGAFL